MFNMFLKPSLLIYHGLHCRLVYDVLDAYFPNSSEILFPLNHCKIWLNIPECPQCEQYTYGEYPNHPKQPDQPNWPENEM